MSETTRVISEVVRTFHHSVGDLAAPEWGDTFVKAVVEVSVNIGVRTIC